LILPCHIIGCPSVTLLVLPPWHYWFSLHGIIGSPSMALLVLPLWHYWFSIHHIGSFSIILLVFLHLHNRFPSAHYIFSLCDIIGCSSVTFLGSPFVTLLILPRSHYWILLWHITCSPSITSVVLSECLLSIYFTFILLMVCSTYTTLFLVFNAEFITLLDKEHPEWNYQAEEEKRRHEKRDTCQVQSKILL